MRDRNTEMYSGGALGVLMGYALDSAMSDYANLPSGIHYSFRCSDPAPIVAPIAAPMAVPQPVPFTAVPPAH